MGKLYLKALLCLTLFSQCSSENSDIQPITEQMEEEMSLEPNVYEDVNQSNLTVDANQMFVVGNNAGSSKQAVVTGGRTIPYGLSFAWIREEHFDGSTPQSVEARNTIEIHSIVGQSLRLSGDGDIEVVGIGKNDNKIGNVGITYVIDRDDDDLPPNGTITILKGLELSMSGYSTYLNGNRGYNSKDIIEMEFEFTMNEGVIAISPNGTEVQTLKFIINPEFMVPDGLYNYNYNEVGNLFELYNNTVDIYDMPSEIPINISLVHIGDGKSNDVVRTFHYQFGD